MPTSQSNPVAMRSVLIIVAALIALVAIALLVVTQFKRFPSGGNGPQSAADTLPAPDVGKTIPTKTMSGTVKTIESDSVVFAVVAVPAQNGLKYEQSDRTARVTSETKITLLVERSSAEMLRLLKAYSEAMKNADPLKSPNPPEPFTERTVTLSDIREGDQIMVQSVGDADISSSKDFDVSLIKIHRTE